MPNPPTNSHTRDFFTSPALTLSLATNVERVPMLSVSRSPEFRRDDTATAEINDDYSGAVRLRPGDEIYGGYDFDGTRNKKNKKCHRHTAEQIREMDALFKDSPHPDEKQRAQLSKQLGLAPRQVKFWFQNRRTQIKTIHERRENSLLKSEVDKLREENETIRETIRKSRCPNCGSATTSSRDSLGSELHQLHIENAKLRAELEKLRTTMEKQ